MRIISYGGGVQSTAMVILAATKDPDFEKACGGPIDAALFSNVGDASEHPATLEYVRNVIQPWGEEHGLPIEILTRKDKAGNDRTLYGDIMNKERMLSVPMPVRMSNGAPGRRVCTSDYKVKVIHKWLKEHGATADDPAIQAIGISTDEFQRASSHHLEFERRIYPLITLGMSRQDCLNVPGTVGLPAPGKSSCFFCPYHKTATWSEMRRDEPELFWKSVELERKINVTRNDSVIARKREAEEAGEEWKTNVSPNVWLTRYNKPLEEAIAEAQDQLPGFESIEESGCDSGHCFT